MKAYSLIFMLVFVAALSAPARGDVCAPPSRNESPHLNEYIRSLRDGYRASCLKKLAAAWSAPQGMHSAAVVTFDVDLQGAATNVAVFKTSGSQAADKSAVKIVEKCSDFGLLPALTSSARAVGSFQPKTSKQKLLLEMTFAEANRQVGLSGSFTNTR